MYSMVSILNSTYHIAYLKVAKGVKSPHHKKKNFCNYV